ncbi:MAG: hypothetical protein WC402_03090 [Candidatus Pacearchaeota archaeon]
MIFFIMKIIITIKDKKDVDSTVDKVLDIGSMLEKKFRGFKMGRCRCLRDGTTLVMER